MEKSSGIDDTERDFVVSGNVDSSGSVNSVPEFLVGVPLEDLVVSFSDVVTALEDPERAIDTDGDINSTDSVVVSFRS